MDKNWADNLPLGKETIYATQYDPSLLLGIPRKAARDEFGLEKGKLPFVGHDHWSAYEISWLDPNGKPLMAIGEFKIPATSPNIIESKALKLYLMSFHQTQFPSPDALKVRIIEDLSAVAGEKIEFTLKSSSLFLERHILKSTCLDALEVECRVYHPDASLLKLANSEERVEQSFHTHAFRSTCPVTHQPDWATIEVRYRGRAIQAESLLHYLVSFRMHQGFHEQCVEKIFLEIQAKCAPEALCVEGFFTRRGGLDISPCRATHAEFLSSTFRRVSRQ